MNRIQFFELEDLPWFPKILRDAATGVLSASHRVLRLDELFIPRILEVLRKAGATTIVDLGSGAGGPLPDILKKLRRVHGLEQLSATLTDYYPNQDALMRYQEASERSFLRYHPESVDASRVPESLKGLRTMFLSFHHMPEPVARGILRDAQASGQPIAIFEVFGRNFASFLGTIPVGIVPFFLIPCVKPFRWANLFFTYVVPLIPFLFFFDGWVSFLRTYSPPELRRMTESLARDPSYCWEIGEIGVQRAAYLIGYSVTSAGDGRDSKQRN